LSRSVYERFPLAIDGSGRVTHIRKEPGCACGKTPFLEIGPTPGWLTLPDATLRCATREPRGTRRDLAASATTAHDLRTRALDSQRVGFTGWRGALAAGSMESAHEFADVRARAISPLRPIPREFT